MSNVILIVDHNSEQRVSLQKLLIDNGYDVMLANSPNEALGLVLNSIQLILINLDADEAENDALLTHLSSNGASVPFVCYTEDDDIDFALKAMRFGAFDYFMMPMDEKALLITIKRAIEDADMFSKMSALTTAHLSGSKKDLAEIRINLAKEIITKRQAEGKRMSKNEIMSLLSPDDPLPGNFTEEFKALLKDNGLSFDENIKERLLIVEDEKMHRESFRLYLEDIYDLEFAEDCSAVQHFVDDMAPIDVVLLDIMLPDGKGVDLIQNIKKMHPECEIVMVTGYRITDLALQGFREGAYDYINKPVTRSDLLFTISKALHRKFMRQALSECGHLVVESGLDDRAKEKMAKKAFEKSRTDGVSFTVRDLTVFFPELNTCENLDRDYVITYDDYQDGFIMFVQQELYHDHRRRVAKGQMGD